MQAFPRVDNDGKFIEFEWSFADGSSETAVAYDYPFLLAGSTVAAETRAIGGKDDTSTPIEFTSPLEGDSGVQWSWHGTAALYVMKGNGHLSVVCPKRHRLMVEAILPVTVVTV